MDSSSFAPSYDGPGVYVLAVSANPAELYADKCLYRYHRPPAIVREQPLSELCSIPGAQIVKIGASSNISRRVAGLRRFHYQMIQIGNIPTTNPFLVESFLHSHFRERRVELNRLLPSGPNVHHTEWLGGEFFLLEPSLRDELLTSDWQQVVDAWTKTISREEVLLCSYEHFLPRMIHPDCELSGAASGHAEYSCFWEGSTSLERCDRCIDRIHANNRIKNMYSLLKREEYDEKASILREYYMSLCSHSSARVRRTLVWCLSPILWSCTPGEFERFSILLDDDDLETRVAFFKVYIHSYKLLPRDSWKDRINRGLEAKCDHLFIYAISAALSRGVAISDGLWDRLKQIIPTAHGDEISHFLGTRVHPDHLFQHIMKLPSDILTTLARALTREDLTKGSSFTIGMVGGLVRLIAESAPVSGEVYNALRQLEPLLTVSELTEKTRSEFKRVLAAGARDVQQ